MVDNKEWSADDLLVNDLKKERFMGKVVYLPKSGNRQNIKGGARN